MENVFLIPDRAKQRAVTLLLQHIDRLVRESSAGLLEGIETGIEVDKGELQTQR